MKRILISLIAISTLFACSKDGDSRKPEISDLNINNKTEEIEVEAGQSASINFTVSDNEGLSQIRMDIHDAFDGHTHGKTNAFNKFFWEQIDTLNGLTEFTGNITLDIPDSVAAGPYHLDVIVVDLAGNQSDIGLLDLVVESDYNAEITVTSHDFSNQVHVDKGTNLVVQGMITDDIDLTDVVIVVEKEGHGHTHGKTSSAELYLNDHDLAGPNNVSFTINETINIPSNTKDGDYKLEIVATDSDGNISIFHGELHIH
jgi:uncharacterized membrane protein